MRRAPAVVRPVLGHVRVRVVHGGLVRRLGQGRTRGLVARVTVVLLAGRAGRVWRGGDGPDLQPVVRGEAGVRGPLHGRRGVLGLDVLSLALVAHVAVGLVVDRLSVVLFDNPARTAEIRHVGVGVVRTHTVLLVCRYVNRGPVLIDGFGRLRTLRRCSRIRRREA